MREHRASAAFYASCWLIVASLALTCLWLASREYFFGEDFLFLKQAQEPRRWLHVFFPLGARMWWSYRPLSIETYYSSLYAIAGLNAFPYLLANLVAHFAAGGLVYRLARQLAFDRRVAAFCAVLSVAMYPTLMHELFWTSMFQLVAVRFFYLLTCTLFVDYLRSRRPIHQIAACASMVATLLTNESGMTLPGPLVLLAFHESRGDVRTRLRATLSAAAPQIAILALYLPFRFWLIGPSYLKTPAFYAPHLGWNVPRNVLDSLAYLTKLSTLLAGVLLASLVAAWAAALRRGRVEVVRLASLCLLLTGWLVATMVPFVTTYFIHHRAAMIMESPFCLVVGAHLDALMRSAASLQMRRALEAALVGVLLLAIPYDALRSQSLSPRGAVNRELLAILAADELPMGACVRLDTRPGDEFTATELEELSFRSGAVLVVAHPGSHLELPPPPGEPAVRRTDCTEIVVIEVTHGPRDSPLNYQLHRIARPVATAPASP